MGIVSWLRQRPELTATLASLVALLGTMTFHGGRVLVLPALFTLILVLLYWAAKPRSKSQLKE